MTHLLFLKKISVKINTDESNKNNKLWSKFIRIVHLRGNVSTLVFNWRLSLHRLFDCFITLDVLIILYQVAHKFSAFSLLISPKLDHNGHRQLRNVRRRPNVALFRRQTKLSELSSWKVLVTSGSVKFVWMSLDRATCSICLLQMARTSEGSLRAKCWS